MDAQKPLIKLITQNKRARLDYEIELELEAGIVLLGSEVKSIRGGKVHIDGAYVRMKGDEVFLVGARILEYTFANRQNHEPTGDRKLLLRRSEIDRIATRVRERGFTMIPMKLYWKDAHVKLSFGLGKGKKSHDKREDLKTKESKREMDRAMKAFKR